MPTSHQPRMMVLLVHSEMQLHMRLLMEGCTGSLWVDHMQSATLRRFEIYCMAAERVRKYVCLVAFMPAGVHVLVTNAAASSKVLSVSIERAYYMCCSHCLSHGIIGVRLQLMYTVQEGHKCNSVQVAETYTGDSASPFHPLVSA